LIPDLTRDDLEAIFRGDANNAYAMRYPMYPLLSPGMPPAGPNMIAHAKALGDDTPYEFEGKGKDKRAVSVGYMLQCLYLRCLYDNEFSLPIKLKGVTEPARVIPGHLWNSAPDGPKYLEDEYLEGRPRVMVVGKMPGQEELRDGRNLCGPSGRQLRETLIAIGVDEADLGDWYVCNLVRWAHLNPQSSAVPAAWIKDCLPLLHQDIRFYLPDYILCLGAEATKAVCGSGHTVNNMIGRYIEIEEPLHEPGDEPIMHKMKVMSVTHPAAVLRRTERFPQFEATLRNFSQLIRGEEFTASSDKEITVQCVYTERELRELVDFVLSKPGLKKIAVDGEWHGQHPGDPGSYLRTIQLSWHGKHSIVVVLRQQGGDAVFMPSIPSAISQLQRLLDRDDVQLGGSFFSSDLPWLEHIGLHIAHRFCVPPAVADVRGGDYAGGFDVALAHHAYNETGDFKLEVMASRLCGADRWDAALNEWKKAYLAERKMKDEELEGYGECPDDILLPYGGKDAAYTRQLMDIHCKLLNADLFGNDCWTPFHISMMAFPAFNEMGTMGVKVDRERINALTDTFQEARTSKLQALREAIHWPTFNPRSPQQSVEFLFGQAYSTKFDKDSGERLSVRPSGAVTLNLPPVKTTGKGKPWAWVEARGDTNKFSPSTDKEVCGILGLQHPLALQLRDVRLVDQVLKSVFRPPLVRKGETEMARDREGRRVYAGGIAKFICYDERVRSSFQQVKETGRASSARPPLQNISKRREQDYKRILGDRYNWPIRSFIVSNTDVDYGEPTVLVEADYRGAELLGMAVMSRDPTMLDHCLRANLDDDDPNFYDIHSHIAVLAFRLDCEPTKAGLESIDQVGKRIAAKNIIFGVGYGRTAEACARQCQEEGVPITTSEAQQIINTIFELYPGIPRLQDALRARVSEPGWIKNCFGRYRRFIATSDRGAMGELERQALNFPFQSMVADAVSTALYYLYRHQRKSELGYKIALQLHDAVILEVPLRSLDAVCHEILPECMVESVPFRACDLSGVPFTDSPEYRFGIDVDVATRWGVKLSLQECDELGISHEYGSAKAG